MTNKQEKFRKISFDDNGQDFTFWIINEDNVVVDSQPFQCQIWRGVKLIDGIEAGCFPTIQRGDEESAQLIHRIIEIKTPSEYFPFWETPDVDVVQEERNPTDKKKESK